jgi:hypothetical protein
MFNVDKQYVDKILWDDIIPEQAQQDMVYDLVRNVPEHYTIAKLVEKYKLKQIDLAIFYEVQLSYREPDLQELEESIGDFVKGLPIVKQILQRNRNKMEAERLERLRKAIKNRSEKEWFDYIILGVAYDKAPQPIDSLSKKPYEMGSMEMTAWLQGFANLFRYVTSYLKYNIETGTGYIPSSYESCSPDAFAKTCRTLRSKYDSMYIQNEAAKNQTSMAESIEQAVNNDEELAENILDNIPKMSMSKLRTKSKFKRKQKKW